MIRINLLPVREARKRAEIRYQIGLMILAIIAGVGISVLAHGWMQARIMSAQRRVTTLTAEISRYAPEMKQLKSFEAKRKEVERKLDVIRGLERSRTGPVLALDELATNTPKRLWLTHFSAQRAAVELEGKSLDNEVVADFLTVLDRSEHFTGVDLEGTEFEEQDGIRLNHFRVKARLANAATDPDLQEEGAGKKRKGKMRRKRGGKGKKAGLIR